MLKYRRKKTEMAIDEKTIEELEARVGIIGQPLLYEIEKSFIRRFAVAVGDDNPLWQKGYAPPNLILTLGFSGMFKKYIEDPDITVLHGGTDLECHRPVKAGDVISAVSSVKNVRQRQGEAGPMLFVTFDISYSNQRKERVADCRQMVIIY
jgi:hypothetical protein